MDGRDVATVFPELHNHRMQKRRELAQSRHPWLIHLTRRRDHVIASHQNPIVHIRVQRARATLASARHPIARTAVTGGLVVERPRPSWVGDPCLIVGPGSIHALERAGQPDTSQQAGLEVLATSRSSSGGLVAVRGVLQGLPGGRRFEREFGLMLQKKDPRHAHAQPLHLVDVTRPTTRYP